MLANWADGLGWHTVRATYGTPEAGARTPCVQCVAAWGRAALRLRYVQVRSTQEAGTRGPYVQHGGPGAYV